MKATIMEQRINYSKVAPEGIRARVFRLSGPR